jgi:hypothetical protein
VPIDRNNRPLTLVEVEDEEFELITPNHFAMQRANFQNVPKEDKRILNVNNNYASLHQFMTRVWERYANAYLPTILIREKWLVPSKDKLKIDDIVLVFDTDTRDSYRLGRITNIKEGSKAQVRRVEVILGKNKRMSYKKNITSDYINECQKLVTRPATKIIKLIDGSLLPNDTPHKNVNFEE